jgi:serpin B
MNRMISNRPLVNVLGAVLLLSACSSPAEPQEVQPIESLPRQLTADERALADAGEAFAFDFLGEIARGEDPTANIFVSPLSASMALGMALAGAEAGTFEAMREALRLGGLGREAIGVSYRSLMDLLSGLDPAVRLEIGNSVWHREGFALEDAYVSEVERDFLARVEALDFNDPGAADLINAWVSEATDDLIEGIVDPPIDPLTMAFLINAIYFEGAWTLQFDPERTASGDFRRPDGSTVSVLFRHTGVRRIARRRGMGRDHRRTARDRAARGAPQVHARVRQQPERCPESARDGGRLRPGGGRLLSHASGRAGHAAPHQPREAEGVRGRG